MTSPRLFGVLAVLNAPVYLLLFRTCFDDLREVLYGVWQWEAPFLSLLWDPTGGRNDSNFPAAIKLLWVGMLCALLVVLEYNSLIEHAPGLARWLQHAW